MSDETQAAVGGPEQVLARAHQLFLNNELASFADMFAEDGTHELPFAPPGVPPVLQGKAAIREYLSLIADTPLELKGFRDLTIHHTTDPEVIITEYTAHMTLNATGEAVYPRYIQVLRARDGEIVTWRDYWNPLAGAQALGTLPQLFAALSGERPSS